jgi:hypothetical protein
MAQHATDPDLRPQPSYTAAPEPAIYLYVPIDQRNLCNTYVPTTTKTLRRLLWAVQYFVASGFYVVVGISLV